MTANFWKWEVDPFFAAAEDVQESTDRLESSYRTWIHETALLAAAPHDSETLLAVDFRRCHLRTALGTAKWQVEEFERAVAQAALGCHVDDDAPTRHWQFVQAINNKIAMIEKGMIDAEKELEVRSMPARRLKNDDNDILAKFLSVRSSVVSDIAEQMNAFQRGQDESPDLSPVARDSRQHILLAGTLPPSTKAGGVSETRSTFVCSSPSSIVFNTMNTDYQFLHPLTKNDNDSVAIHFDGVKDSLTRHLPNRTGEERIICMDDRSRGSFEGTNEWQRSVTVNSGLDCWKVEALPKNADDTKPGRCNSASNNITLWALFSKKKRPVSSDCGFKRWKDGDSDSSYSSLDKMGNELEWGLSDSWMRDKRLSNGYALGPILVGEERPNWGLQRPQYPFSSVQIASAILVALGFVGLLSFHATASV